MSKFSSFMKGTGQVLAAIAEANFASKKAPIDSIQNTVNQIDWEHYNASTVLYGMTDEDIQKLRDAQSILSRFPRKY